MSYLAVENALKRFGPNFTALDGVSISVDRGEFFTLLDRPDAARPRFCAPSPVSTT